MGRGHGGSRGSRPGGGMSARANELASQYLGGVSNPALRKELAEGLAEFEKEFGLPTNLTVSVSNMEALGAMNGLGQLRINSEYESGSRSASEGRKTFIHELTHGIDKTDTHHTENISGIKMQGWKPVGVLKTENKGFDRKLTAAYKHFKSNYSRSESAQQIGRYALKSKHEFFAEALSSHMTGTQNKYTTFAYNLAKSMGGK